MEVCSFVPTPWEGEGCPEENTTDIIAVPIVHNVKPNWNAAARFVSIPFQETDVQICRNAKFTT